MSETIDQLLTQRAHRFGTKQRKQTLIFSVALHVVILGGAIIVPHLTGGEREQFEYVAVQIVPAQVLGSTTAPPDPAPKPRAPEPDPTPAPVQPPKPKPTAKKPPAGTMELPTRKVTKPTPTTPSTGTSSGAQRRGSATGSSLGTSRFGAAAATFDNADFTYAYYVDQMLTMIHANWVRPTLGGNIESLIHFTIRSDGSVSDIRIVRSSGYNTFDLAARRAIQSASPLPPLPKSYRHGTLGVNLIVR